MKKYIVSLLFILPLLTQAQFEEDIKLNDAVSASYDIRTAAVKIVKDYIYSNFYVNYAFKEMDNSFSTSEDAILLLEIYTQDKPEAFKLLSKLKALRKKSRMMFLHKPKKEKMKKVVGLIEKLMQLNNNLIKSVKTGANVQVSPEIEKARNIEILIQQVSFLYALKAKGNNNPEISNKINMLGKKINMLTNGLQQSSNNTEDTTYYLQLLKSDIDMFNKTIHTKQKESFLNTVYVLSTKIGNNAYKLANMYQ